VTPPSWLQRFLVKGVFWRQFLRWAVLNVPIWLEPIVIGSWALFFLLWGPGRRGVMRNLTAIKPGSTAPANFLRTYRVFWNYAWTITDNVRYREMRTIPDWEFVGIEEFDQMRSRAGGAIMLTAHMGSYDLGAHLFSETSHRTITMVRAPETDAQTRDYEERFHDRTAPEAFRVEFNTKASDLALDLLHALQRGEIVAIQGDRVTPGIAAIRTTMFGRATDIPAGPFALAMTARVPIFPVFVVRLGRRRYRLLTCPAIEVVRSSRNRDEDFAPAVSAWVRELENVIRGCWFQWFTFEPFSEELAA
jgi:predicted LPLAT superfamily acyltransferase